MGGARHCHPLAPQCPPLPPPCPTFPRSCQSAGLRANKLHLAGWRRPSPASRGGTSIPWQHNSPAARGAQPRAGTGPAPRPSRHPPGDRQGTGTAQPLRPASPASKGMARVSLSPPSPQSHSRPRVVPGDALRVGRALRTEGQLVLCPLPCSQPQEGDRPVGTSLGTRRLPRRWHVPTAGKEPSACGHRLGAASPYVALSTQ